MSIPFVSQEGGCKVCGRGVEGYEGEYVCEKCRERAPFFDVAVGAVDFAGEMRETVLRYKDAKALWLTEDFADWMEAAGRSRIDVSLADIVLPVPSTLMRRIDRGVNPAVCLAQALARRIGRSFRGDVLRRVGAPKKQANLSEDERWENAEDSFAVIRPEFVKGRTILLVDDIQTTGATLSGCAKALKMAGAWRVWCISLARAVWNS
ncbi:MAG: ComF family protein [Kiritimatiellae bacterium]|nr:ComF family protein [Kiritimatiellia bacterium]